ncbi:unnamed protein product [Discula destructiva]
MRSFTLLATLASFVAAAPHPGIDGPSVDVSDWTVRADWSRCSDPSAYEVVLQGVIAAKGVTAGAGIVDFKVPEGSYTGGFDLVLKSSGSLGFGSPVPPAMVNVQVLEAADASGNVGVATYKPPQAGATTTENIAQVAWFTSATQSYVPASHIGYTTLQQNATASAGTTVSPSFLRVFYCSCPETFCYQ